MHLFVEVAGAGGFRAAAERIGLPNSTLSRRISELEATLGLRLFHRTTRKVELTEAGRLYYDRCRRIMEEARLAQEELSGMVSQPTGVIRASVPVDFTLLYLSDPLADFLNTYPGIQLELDVTPRQSSLISDAVDLTIRIGPVKEQTLIARKLGQFRTSLFAAPAYLAAQGIPALPADLLRHNCLRMTDQPWRLHHLATAEVVTVPVTGTVTANNLGLLRKFALTGMGIIVLTQEIARDDLAEGRLVPVLPGWAPPDVIVSALTETRLLPAKVRVFIDFLTQRMREKISGSAPDAN